MLLVDTPWARALHLMNGTRSRDRLLATIALMAALEVVVVLVALYSGDVTERVSDLVTKVLLSIAGILSVLLLVLRMESVKATVEGVDRKADRAAVRADTAAAASTVAAQKAAVVERKVDTVHYALMNGDMRENLKRAILELEDDPDVQAARIERIARGVQKDRHDLRQRETAERGWEGLERRGIRRPNPDDQP
jgi:hypothetical protein